VSTVSRVSDLALSRRVVYRVSRYFHCTQSVVVYMRMQVGKDHECNANGKVALKATGSYK
jgi:hypothetical protein